MAAETEFEGRTEEEALKRASEALGVPVKELDYTVLDAGSGGILGFGARNARVRVRGGGAPLAAAPQPAVTAAAPVAPAAPAPAATAPAATAARHDEDDDAPGGIVGPAPEKAAKAEEVASALAAKMGMRVSVSVRDEERDIVVVLAEAEGSTDVADMLGGSRPPGVPSFQFLLNKIVNRFPEGRKHIVLEAPSVEARVVERRSAPRPAPAAAPAAPPSPPPPLPADVDPLLATAARELAEKARTLGRVYTIHPMSSADRRAVHVTITGLEGVQTVSEGDGLYRKIHVVPSTLGASQGGGDRKRRRRRRRRRGGPEGAEAPRDEEGAGEPAAPMAPASDAGG